MIYIVNRLWYSKLPDLTIYITTSTLPDYWYNRYIYIPIICYYTQLLVYTQTQYLNWLPNYLATNYLTTHYHGLPNYPTIDYPTTSLYLATHTTHNKHNTPSPYTRQQTWNSPPPTHKPQQTYIWHLFQMTGAWQTASWSHLTETQITHTLDRHKNSFQIALDRDTESYTDRDESWLNYYIKKIKKCITVLMKSPRSP